MGLYWAVPAPGGGDAAFVAVALAIGWLWAACLFLATSLSGLLILLRDRAAATSIASATAFRRDGIRAIHLESPGLGADARWDSACISGLYHRHRRAPCCSSRRSGAQLRAADRARAPRRAGGSAIPRSIDLDTGRVAPGLRQADRGRRGRTQTASDSRADPCPAEAAVLATPPTSVTSPGCGGGNAHDVHTQRRPAAAAAAANQAQLPQLNVLGQYVKDFSFENPNAPRSLAPSQAAAADQRPDQRRRQPACRDRLRGHAQARRQGRIAGQVLFAFDLTFCGVFRIQNIPQEHIQPMVMIECPRLLFPFAREIDRDRGAQRRLRAVPARSGRFRRAVSAADGAAAAAATPQFTLPT